MRKMSNEGIREQNSILTVEPVRGIAETYGIDMRVIAAVRSSERVRVPPKR